jgi:16S rRNA (adenine1518-N6/adenine1519-N6)-dimethyltransferase
LPPKLGQHFLHSDAILNGIVRAACGEGVARVVEIGPGRGALTRLLLPHTDELHVIELDRELARSLQERYAGDPQMHVHEGDVLETDLSQWGAAVVVGNLPYYITSPVIERFTSLPESFERAVFLVQHEVAQRLVSGPGTRDYGYLTVATQLICDVEFLMLVRPSAFRPPPKVDSAVVRLSRKRQRPEHLPELLRFVGRCFAQKRKTLRNNLKPYYGGAIDALPEAGLRAEQLPLDGFAHLWERLKPGLGGALQ